MALSGLAAGLTLAACTSSPADTAHQVQAWATSTGFSAALRQLRGDLSRLSGLAAEGGGTRRTVCDVLVTDALNDNQQLPAPDTTLTSLLSAAYSEAAGAGRDCFTTATGLSAAQAEGAAAGRQLTRAEARYDALTSDLGVSS